jgi:hypothetical protein
MVKQDNKRNTNGDTVETASRVMTRLNGDLRWIWNKLQVKHPVGLSSLQINKVEEPIDIKDNEDEVWEIIKIQKREEKVCLPSCHQSRELVHQIADLQFTSRNTGSSKSSTKPSPVGTLVHQIADLQFTSTNTGLSNGYSTLLQPCQMVIKLMKSVEETNQVQTKGACNTSTIESNQSVMVGADPSYIHGFINHRDTEVVTKTIEKSSSELREKFGTMVERDLQIEVVCKTSDELYEDDNDINDREDDCLPFITPTSMGKVKDDLSNDIVTRLERYFPLNRGVQRVRKRERSNRS